MSEQAVETETVRVQARVPKYQKEEWKEHADRLDMSQSEFIQTMVQAGRRGFEGTESGSSSSNPEEAGDGGSDPRGRGLETRVQTTLREEGALSWDELVEVLAGDFEDRLEDALDELQTANQVKFSGPDGGYVLTDDDE